jgi:hypothetical protein
VAYEGPREARPGWLWGVNVYWAFVEINEVDTTNHKFDYSICWRKWNGSGRLQSVRWCLAAFIIFEATASREDRIVTDKVYTEIDSVSNNGRKKEDKSLRKAIYRVSP